MKTLYVTDLDGTLLNMHDQISEYSMQVINSLVENGMTFTYATARSLSSASIVTRGLTANIPIVIYNGAFILNAATGEKLSANIFNENEKQFIVDLLTYNKIYPLVYACIDGAEKVSWLRNKENDGFRRYIGLRKGDKRLNPLASGEGLYAGEAFYFTCIGEKEELLPIYDSLKNNPHYNCILQQELYREEYWCEIMHKNATKANAILRLKEILHCDRVVSFGDALNDIPMFSISDECYAVENAVAELKAVSTGIIGSNNDNGVAKWLYNNYNEA